MAPKEVLTLTSLFFLMAVLYSSVGHAGASGYLAAMALIGMAPEIMRPTALSLNILVATIATVQYYRQGCFSWPLFWPFALASMPLAFLGGHIHLPAAIYGPLVGLVLIYAAWQSLRKVSRMETHRIHPPPLAVSVISGAAIGLLSGLTGVGGGVFLSPLLLLRNWAEPRTISGVAAPFILTNSISGFLGLIAGTPELPSALPLWGVAVVAGGLLGAEYGSRRLGNLTIVRLLAIVLAIAGAKMVLSA